MATKRRVGLIALIAVISTLLLPVAFTETAGAAAATPATYDSSWGTLIVGTNSYGMATCGMGIYYTCSFYFDVATTRGLAMFMGGDYSATKGALAALAMGIACAPFGGVTGLVCGGLGFITYSYFNDMLNAAAANNQCIRVRFIPFYGFYVGYWLYREDVSTQFCRWDI